LPSAKAELFRQFSNVSSLCQLAELEWIKKEQTYINNKQLHIMTQKKEVQFYELDKVQFIIKEATDLDVAYAYEDLVFSEHAIFIIQFDNKPNSLICWFNDECIETERYAIFKSLTSHASANGMKVAYKGKFEMTQKDDEEQLSVKFKKVLKYQPTE